MLHFDTAVPHGHRPQRGPEPGRHRPQPGNPAGGADPTRRHGLCDFANQPAGTYDDEMLNAHFVSGDGRVNENIGLTSIHQVFHSEHDRLVEDIKNTLTNDTSAKGVAALADWKLAAGAGGWNGERLFQAARFVTEMEYQHLVFEEFARKVQPAIQPFHVYHSDVDPAIKAEFAHAVYRFGHSMLTETIARSTRTARQRHLAAGRLPEPAVLHRRRQLPGKLTSEAGGGSIVMGMCDQVGNELDEFVTEHAAQQPAGAAARPRDDQHDPGPDAGVPPLNEVRRQIYRRHRRRPADAVHELGRLRPEPQAPRVAGQLRRRLRHATRPSPRTTLRAGGRRPSRSSTRAPATPPDGRHVDFMNSAGAWANEETGLNVVDLWVGGLAEKTNLFGGLLGSTFNYVFENQMTDLQNGDRLYYLARTPGMNLRVQLEGNCFAEMIMRNTNAHSLKADVFATADCRFQLGNLAGTAGRATPPIGSPPSPTTRRPTATRTCCSCACRTAPSSTGEEHGRPAGINGQSVYNGTAGADRVSGGNDNDTFWGDDGNDVIEGDGGDDIALGGDGNDRITDLAGADVFKGGPGNDYINAGIGDDIILAGDGQDFTNGGANDNETFGGPGNDFVQAGHGADAVFGDGGDDWIEGGSGQDLLHGDHGAPFFDDPAQTNPATTSSSARSARTTTTPRAATTS